MKHSMPALVAFLLLATSAIYAQPVLSAPYTGTPAGTSSGEVLCTCCGADADAQSTPAAVGDHAGD